jgi:predicted aspartyl protease
MSLPDFLEAAGYRRIPLSRNGVGHFEASGTLVGRAVRVLIDTGTASTVVSLSLAQELGLNPISLGRKGRWGGRRSAGDLSGA